MKKLFFAVAALFVSVSMSAQIWVGGSLGFDTKSYAQEGRKTTTAFTLSPVAGYALSDVFEVGLGVDFSTTSNYGGIDGAKRTSWGIEPFARYYFLSEDKISLFLQGEIGVNQYKAGDNSAKTGFKFGVEPGIKIPLNENLAIVSTFGWLGFAKSSADESTDLALSLKSALSFGLYYAF